MRNNYRLLQKQILELENTISDEELFTASAYQSYQTALAEAATKRYRHGLQVFMQWNESNEAPVAYTDNNAIHSNAANHITQSFPSRFLRSQSLTGVTGHEVGHLLYSDFASRDIYIRSMANGCFYPETPSFSQLQHEKNLKELTDSMEDKQKAVCLTLAQCAASIQNILEDIYIENRMCMDFPGSFKQGISLNNLRMCEQMPSIGAQEANGYKDFSIMSNLLLQYCRAGTVNNLTDYSGPYLDHLEDCAPYIDFSVYEDDIKERFQATNIILVILWNYIKPLVEEMEEKLKHQDEKAASEELEEILGNEIKSGTPLPQGLSGGAPVMGTGPALSPEQSQKQKEEAQAVLQEETKRIALSKTTCIEDGNNPGITYNQQYTGSGYKKAADDLFRILHGVASEQVQTLNEEKLTEELQSKANKLHYGDAHKGIHLTVNRITAVPESMILDYQAVAPELLRASKRLQQKIAPILQSDAEGGKQKYLLMGKRMDMGSYHRTDGALFTRTRLPSDNLKLAVALLVDESGSMDGADRITHARKTAIVLYDFCVKLRIPIVVYGHSTDYEGVALYSYAEFDSMDHKDCYRMMDMSARSGNRDGAALRFVAERLLTQDTSQKLLILISDGQPAASGYSGTEAEADLRAIKQEYTRKGVTMFAAAIGNDKENIKRIYGSGYLDITNMDELPKNMTELVKQYL